MKRDRVNRCVMPWIFACVVLLSCPAVLAQTSDGGESSTEGAGGIRFAIGLVEDLPTYSEPRAGEPDGPFDMPILSPHRIVDERTVDGELWHQIERREGRTTGWVPGRLVAVWNSRHALRPNLISSEGVAIPGYCEYADVARAVAGDSDPCMTFVPEILDRSAERAPFPVLGVSQHRSPEGVEKTYFHVLAPTLYSNIAPVLDVGGGSEGSGSVEELTEALGGTAKTLEVILLLEASAGMADALSATADALWEIAAAARGEREVTLKIAVVAYRPVKKRRGAPLIEWTADDPGRLAFTDARGAYDMVSGLTAAGEGEAAVWDALYALEGLDTEPGSNRELLLVAGAPALPATHGVEVGGFSVPAGLERTDVLAATEDTIGHATAFDCLSTNEAFRPTAELIMGGFNLYDKSFVTIGERSDGVKTHVAAVVKNRSAATRCFADAIVSCQNTITYGDLLAQVGLFCGDAPDPALAARVRDVVDSNEVAVVREVWIPQDRTLDDVALISRKEAASLAIAMGELADLTRPDGSGCADEAVGFEAWMEILDRLVPDGIPRPPVDGASWPVIGAPLHEYWDLEVPIAGSIIKYPPAGLDELNPASCRALGEKLRGASQFMLNSLSAYSNLQYLWFPFDQLP